MLHIVEAGTDAASLLLFDPQSLPEEFDAANATGDPVAILGRMHEEGRLFWIHTGSDGGFLLHAFVDEDVPNKLLPFLRDPKTVESFVVLGGLIVFAGAECAYRKDNSFLTKYPHMGGSFAIENGSYKVTLYRTEYPDSLLEDSFRETVTSWQRRVHGIFHSLAALAVMAVFALLVSVFCLSWRTWLTIALPATIAAIAVPALLTRTPVYRQAQETWSRVQREYPSMVAVFRTNVSEQGDRPERRAAPVE